GSLILDSFSCGVASVFALLVWGTLRLTVSPVGESAGAAAGAGGLGCGVSLSRRVEGRASPGSSVGPRLGGVAGGGAGEEGGGVFAGEQVGVGFGDGVGRGLAFVGRLARFGPRVGPRPPQRRLGALGGVGEEGLRPCVRAACVFTVCPKLPHLYAVPAE